MGTNIAGTSLRASSNPQSVHKQRGGTKIIEGIYQSGGKRRASSLRLGGVRVVALESFTDDKVKAVAVLPAPHTTDHLPREPCIVHHT